MQERILLQLDELQIGYPSRIVARNLNESLKAGELICLVGPNGAGKSTLLRTVAGMQRPVAGSASLLGEDVTSIPPARLAKLLSVVLTERIEAGLMSGYELVSLGRHPYTGWMGQLSDCDVAIVKRAVESVGAVAIASRPVRELSDGERQKLMIARALAQEPAVMLLDEPTAFLDLPRRVEVVLLLKRLALETDRGILMSTHDLDLAIRNADKIWILPGDNSLVSGAPEDLILSGDFERAFSSTGVAFDIRTGAFVAPIAGAGRISLVGEGVRAIWTRMALERAGYQIVPGLALVVEVGDEHWSVRENGVEMEFYCLYDLVAHMKHISRIDS